jgi:hypothetical protein
MLVDCQRNDGHGKVSGMKIKRHKPTSDVPTKAHDFMADASEQRRRRDAAALRAHQQRSAQNKRDQQAVSFTQGARVALRRGPVGRLLG